MPRTFEDLAIFAAPGVFVVLWASGFIGAKFGLPYAEPLTFLSLRMVAVVVLLGLIVLITRPPWPDRAGLAHSAATGLMVHGLYLGGVFVSIENGMPAGLIALVVSLQPVLTSTIANRLLGERVVPRQWFGLLLGLIGVYLIVHEKTESGGTHDDGLGGGRRGADRHDRRHALSETVRRRHRLAARYVDAICGGRDIFRARRRRRSSPGQCNGRPNSCLRSAGSSSCCRSARSGSCISHPPRGGDARGQPVLPDAAGDGADGLGLFDERLAPLALSAWRSASPACSW